MKDDERLPSLDVLQSKIDRIRKPESDELAKSSAADMSRAVRLLVDLVAGVLVGVGFGYLMDSKFETTPWLSILGLFLGVVAGVRNMVRSAELMDKKLAEQQKDDKKI